MSDKYWLTNLAAGEFLHLDVESGSDVIEAAKNHLRESGKPEEVQQGFYVSVYPVSEAEGPLASLEQSSSGGTVTASDLAGGQNSSDGESSDGEAYLDGASGIENAYGIDEAATPPEALDEELSYRPEDGVKA